MASRRLPFPCVQRRKEAIPMCKKVMAVAVATCFAAATVTLAQGSSVQIYGSLTYSLEGAEAKGADTSGAPAPGTGGSSIRGGSIGGGYVASPATPNVNEPWRSRTQGAGSNIGLRGREDLGNGLYMGFQAEIEARVATVRPVSGTEFGTFLTWRNSGVWLGGRWGEFGIGLWDTPFTLNTNNIGAAHAPYGNASTTLQSGVLGVGFADSSVAGQDLGQFCGQNFGQSPTSTVNPTNCFRWATAFSRALEEHSEVVARLMTGPPVRPR